MNDNELFPPTPPGAERLTLTLAEAWQLPEVELQEAFGVILMNYHGRTGVKLIEDRNVFKMTRAEMLAFIGDHQEQFAKQPQRTEWRRVRSR